MKEAKVKNITGEITPNPTANPHPNFTDKAIGCFKNPKTGCWTLMTVEVDPQLLQPGKITTKVLSSDRMLSIDEFKIYLTENQDIFKY